MLFRSLVVELRVAQPMLDLRLFRHPIFRLSMGLNTVLVLSLFGTQFLMPLFLQGVLGLGALDSGLLLIPQGLASFLSMNVSGRLYNRVGPRPLIMFGTGVMAITTWMLAHMDAQTPTIYVAALISTRGLSLGFCMMPNQTAAYNTVPHGGLARATALANGFQRFLSSGASAFLGTILNLRTLAHAAALGATGLVVAAGGEDAPVRASAEAFSDTFLVLTVASGIGFFLALFHRDPILEEKWAQDRSARSTPAGDPPLAAQPLPACTAPSQATAITTERRRPAAPMVGAGRLALAWTITVLKNRSGRRL